MSQTIKPAFPYSMAEEISHAITHGVGAVLSIAGLAVLVAFASMYGDAWHVVSCSIYGATLILMYVASTVYHAVFEEKIKFVLRKIDHAAIYLLIAGTYTPFALVNLREEGGWWIFAAVWTFALVGLVFEIVTLGKYKKISIAMYVGLGWIALLAIKPLMANVGVGGLWLLIGGGLVYSLGVVFYAWTSLKYHHTIWHLFVLVASALHFFAVLFYVIPLA